LRKTALKRKRRSYRKAKWTGFFWDPCRSLPRLSRHHHRLHRNHQSHHTLLRSLEHQNPPIVPRKTDKAIPAKIPARGRHIVWASFPSFRRWALSSASRPWSWGSRGCVFSVGIQKPAAGSKHGWALFWAFCLVWDICYWASSLSLTGLPTGI